MKRFYREYVSEERVYRVLGDRCGLISPPRVRSFPLNFNYPYSNHFDSSSGRATLLGEDSRFLSPLAEGGRAAMFRASGIGLRSARKIVRASSCAVSPPAVRAERCERRLQS